MKSIKSDVASAWTTASRAWRRLRFVELFERTDGAVWIGIDRGADELARRLPEVCPREPGGANDVGEIRPSLAFAGPVERMKSAKSVIESFSTRASLGTAVILEAFDLTLWCVMVGDGNGGASAATNEGAAFAVEVLDVLRGRIALA